MSFFAESRTRPRLAFDGAMGQEPPLKRLRSLLGVDAPAGEVGYGVGNALGFASDPLSLAALGRTFPDTSFLVGSDAWPLRAVLDEKILAAAAMPMSLVSLGSLGMPSAAAAFIERNLPKLESPQIMPGVAQAHPLAGLAGIQAPGLPPLGHSRSKTKLCKHFIEGKCKFNDICNFAHSIEELKSMPGDGDLEGKALVDKYRAKADTEKQAAGSGQDAISPGDWKTKLCKHFIEGECRFKDGCHFAHSIQELKKLPDDGDDAGKALLERYKSVNLVTSGADPVQGVELSVSTSTGAMELKTKLCKHFIVGTCKYKESCTFAHSIEELKKLPAGDGDDAGKALFEQYRSASKVEKALSGHDAVQTDETAKADVLAKSKVEKTLLDAEKASLNQKPALESTGKAPADAKVDDKSIRLMKTKMCKHFLVGACKYMDICTFAHSIEELKPPADVKDLVTKTTPTASAASPSKKTSTAVASTDQQAPAQSAQQPDEKQSKDDKQGLQKTKACRFFLDGICRFGDACTFIHGNEQIPANGGTSQLGVQHSGEMKATYKTRLCNMWEKDKTCTFGSKCHFAHGPEELRPRAGPSIPGSSSLPYGASEIEALSRARQLGLPMSLPYSYEVTDTNWRPFQIMEKSWNGFGGVLAPSLDERGMDMEASQAHLRGLLQNYGQLEQASSLASLSSLGGVNLGLASSMFANLPLWQAR